MRRRIDLLRRGLAALPGLARLRADSAQTVADRFEACAAAHPERPFLLFDEGEPRPLGYGAADAAASRVAHWALGIPLRRGDVVALLMQNRPEYVTTWLGLAKVGVTTALLNAHLTGTALRHALEASRARTLIVGSECLAQLASVRLDSEPRIAVWIANDPAASAGQAAPAPAGARDLDAALAEQATRPPDPAVREELRCGDDLFYIYTSGTTGLPKAARFSHLRFLGIGIGAAALEMDPEDVHYCALPLYHSAGGVMMVSTTLAAGSALALRRHFSASAFWSDCRRFGATRFQYIGEFCRYLVNQPPRPDDREHRVRIAIGNGMRPDVWSAFQERFGIERVIEFYGATEGNAILVNLDGEVGAVGRIPFGRIGRRLSNARLVRFDVESGTHVRGTDGFCVECAPDEVGELLGRIPERARGLNGRFEGYTSAEATAQKVLKDVFEKGDAWFRSGDLLRCDARGWFRFVDRIGDTFRWKGENVSTQEVEETLTGFPGVDVANVYGVRVSGHDGRAGMAALVLAPDARRRFDPAALFAYVDERLPRYAAPLFVRLLESAETTGTFKLRKVTLQAEGADPGRVTDPLYFRDDAARAYRPLTPSLRQQIDTGERRV